MTQMSRLAVPLAALALLGASPIEREIQPGEGVLCIGTFLYAAQLQGETCAAGQDPEYQKRLLDYRERLDAYLVRNFPNGQEDLARFKKDQGVSAPADKRICELTDVDDIYGHIRKFDAAKLDADLIKMLKRDGPPTFGDCT